MSGFAGLIATVEDNPWPAFPKPTIAIYFVLKKDGGEYSPLLVVQWSKDGVNILGTEIEKAKIFYVNFWALQRIA